MRFSSGVWAIMVVLAACHGDATAPSASIPASPPSTSQADSASPTSPSTSTSPPSTSTSQTGQHRPRPSGCTSPVFLQSVPIASMPAIGKLVLSLREYGTKSFVEVDLNVYADGRMIWQKWDHSADAGVVPDGANRVDTGFVERRLTSQGDPTPPIEDPVDRSVREQAPEAPRRQAACPGSYTRAGRRSMGVGRGVAQTVPIVEEALHEGNTGPGASARAARRRHLRRSGGMASDHSVGRP